MIGRLFNKARKERELDEQKERMRPQWERFVAEHKRRQEVYEIWESDAPWRNTRRIKCACGNTARYDIPKLPATFRCQKCGGRQTLIG